MFQPGNGDLLLDGPGKTFESALVNLGELSSIPLSHAAFRQKKIGELSSMVVFL